MFEAKAKETKTMFLPQNETWTTPQDIERINVKSRNCRCLVVSACDSLGKGIHEKGQRTGTASSFPIWPRSSTLSPLFPRLKSACRLVVLAGRARARRKRLTRRHGPVPASTRRPRQGRLTSRLRALFRKHRACQHGEDPDTLREHLLAALPKRFRKGENDFNATFSNVDNSLKKNATQT